MHVICGKCSSLIVIHEEERSADADCILLSSKSQPSQAIKNDLHVTPEAGSCSLLPPDSSTFFSISSSSFSSTSSYPSSASRSLASSLSSLPWRDVIFSRILIHLHLTDLFRMRRVSRTFCHMINSYFQQMDQLDMSEVTSLGFNSKAFAVIMRQKKQEKKHPQLRDHSCETSLSTSPPPSPPSFSSLFPESYESGENESTQRGSGNPNPNHINSPAPASPAAPGHHEEDDVEEEGLLQHHHHDYSGCTGTEGSAHIRTLNLRNCKWLTDHDVRDVMAANPRQLCALDLSACFEVRESERHSMRRCKVLSFCFCFACTKKNASTRGATSF